MGDVNVIVRNQAESVGNVMISLIENIGDVGVPLALRIIALMHCAIHRGDEGHELTPMFRITQAATSSSPSPGLSTAELAAATTTDISGVPATICHICHVPLTESPTEGADATLRQVVHCGHTFHAECVGRWFQMSTTCPSCRHDLRPAAA